MDCIHKLSANGSYSLLHEQSSIMNRINRTPSQKDGLKTEIYNYLQHMKESFFYFSFLRNFKSKQ